MTNAYHHGDLRQQAQHHALAVLHEHGDAALSLRALAKQLGVTTPALYRHFRNRDSLLAALATDGFQRLRQALLAVPGGHPRDTLIGIGLAYIGFAQAHPNLYRLMFGGQRLPAGQHPELDAAGLAAFAVLEDATAAGQRSGYLGDTPLNTLTAAAWALVHGFAQLSIDGHLPPPEQAPHLARAISALLIDGTRAPASTQNNNSNNL